MLDGVDSAVQIVFVGPPMWPAFCDRVRPHLEKMASRSDGRFLPEDIADAIACGKFQLWLALEGSDILCAFVTEVIQYPRRRAMRGIGIVGHKPRKWLHLVPKIEFAAKNLFGCDLAEALHTPGHERVLGEGWRIFHHLSEKPL